MFEDLEEEDSSFTTILESMPCSIGNPYLEDAAKGLELIRKICNADDETIDNWKKLEQFLEEEIWQCFTEIDLEEEIVYFKQMEKLRDKVREYAGNKNIYNKTIVGIGGMFSAGKSAFINSILNPEDEGNGWLECEQNPTTSIPTYIMKGNEEKVEAFKNTGESIVLEQEEMQALTHQFYDKYGFGFNQYINRIIIQLPSFEYNNIIFLDTPGYSKADSSVKQNFTDRNKAKSQLQAADILIWLVDCENGTIKDSDLQFLQELHSKGKILFVFNKCDKKISEDVETIIAESRNFLDDAGYRYEDIIAYSSRDITRGERDKILRFLCSVNREKINASLEDEITAFLEEISDAMVEKLKTISKYRKECEKNIKNTSNPATINTQCLMYKYFLEEEEKLKNAIEQIFAKKNSLVTYFEKGEDYARK